MPPCPISTCCATPLSCGGQLVPAADLRLTLAPDGHASQSVRLVYNGNPAAPAWDSGYVLVYTHVTGSPPVYTAFGLALHQIVGYDVNSGTDLGNYVRVVYDCANVAGRSYFESGGVYTADNTAGKTTYYLHEGGPSQNDYFAGTIETDTYADDPAFLRSGRVSSPYLLGRYGSAALTKY